MTTTFIHLENISKTYGNTLVLDIEAATIPLNQIIAIVGYSGVGKSTLVNILSLLDIPDGKHARTGKVPRLTIQLAEVRIEVCYRKIPWWQIFKDLAYDFDITITTPTGTVTPSTAEEVRASYFGYVFQEALLHPNFNLLDNIKTPLIIRGTTFNHPWQMLLNSCGLQEQAYKYVNETSGGQQQRTAILRSIINNNPILVGDELTSNLDRDRAEQVLRLFQHIVDNTGKSFLWVTHNIHLAKQFAQQIITIQQQTVSIHENPHSETEIIRLLQNQANSAVLEDIPTITTSPQPSSGYELFRYYAVYALRDLFHNIRVNSPWLQQSPLRFLFYKPTADFFVNFLSISLVLIFLLSLHKISYATQRFLEVKLSDPRINNLEVTPSTVMADNILTNEDVERIRTAIGESHLHHIAPVYKTTLALVRERDQLHFSLSRPALTFERGDKIINNLFPAETINTMGRFINDPIHYDGVILYKGALERLLPRLELTEIPTHLTVAVDKVTRDMPVLISDSPLPDNRHAMLRSDLYLESYHKGVAETDPVIAYILLYPKDIHNTLPIMQTLANASLFSGKEYIVESALDIRKKIEVITEIERLISGIVQWSLIAVAVLTVSFVTLTIYRSLHRKRKEIGVFLAFGMKRRSFLFFYLMEAFLLWTAIVLGTHLTFQYQLNPKINQVIMQTEQMNIKEFSSIQVVQPAMLDLPNTVLAMYYGGSLIMLGCIFIWLIWRTTSRLPTTLIKDR